MFNAHENLRPLANIFFSSRIRRSIYDSFFIVHATMFRAIKFITRGGTFIALEYHSVIIAALTIVWPLVINCKSFCALSKSLFDDLQRTNLP